MRFQANGSAAASALVAHPSFDCEAEWRIARSMELRHAACYAGLLWILAQANLIRGEPLLTPDATVIDLDVDLEKTILSKPSSRCRIVLDGGR